MRLVSNHPSESAGPLVRLAEGRQLTYRIRLALHGEIPPLNRSPLLGLLSKLTGSIAQWRLGVTRLRAGRSVGEEV